MNINEKVADYYKMELNDVKKIIEEIEKSTHPLWKTKEVIQNAINRCYGVFFFAQSFDNFDYEKLAFDYETTREELEKIGGLK